MLKPSAASRCTTARPIPREPPVTSATRWEGMVLTMHHRPGADKLAWRSGSGSLSGPRAVGAQLVRAAVARDEVGEQRAQLSHGVLPEALAQLALHRLALLARASHDPLAGRAEAQPRAAPVGRVARPLEVAERDHVVGQPAGGLLGHAQQL